MPKIRGPSVLITGASSGIGRALALSLAHSGYQVFATVRNKDVVKELKEISEGKLTVLEMDVNHQQHVNEAFDQITKIVGPQGLSVLINNAGIVVSSPLECISLPEFQLQMETNVIGVMRVTQAALPLLRIAKGRILNIGSPSGRVTLPFLGPYSASKAALAMLTRALRMELHPWAIKVTLIEPGDAETPIWDKLLEASLNRQKEIQESHYGNYIKHAENILKKTAQHAMDVNIIVRKITKLLNKEQLKPSYAIGFTAHFWGIIARLVPITLFEFLLKRFFALSTIKATHEKS